MAYNPITQVIIALQTSGLTAQGFGTSLFVADVDVDTDGSPFAANERVRQYSSADAVGEDFGIDSGAYAAAEAFFSNSPSVPSIKVGYRNTGITEDETMADALTAIATQDNDWYFITAQSHLSQDVLDTAAYAEARTKLYFFSSQEENSLTPYDEGTSTDLLAQIRSGNFLRTKGFFHQDADTEFPECLYIGYNAPFLAGGVIWTNLRVQGLSVSQDPATGSPLSDTQKGYLEDRNSAYTERLGGDTVIIRNGKTAGGENIDLIHGRDNLESDINIELQGLLVRQKGQKLPYTNQGITQIYDTVDNVLNRYTLAPRNFINGNYIMNFPMADQVPTIDKEERIYRQGTFRAELQGAIEGVRPITGVLAIQL